MLKFDHVFIFCFFHCMASCQASAHMQWYQPHNNQQGMSDLVCTWLQEPCNLVFHLYQHCYWVLQYAQYPGQLILNILFNQIPNSMAWCLCEWCYWGVKTKDHSKLMLWRIWLIFMWIFFYNPYDILNRLLSTNPSPNKEFLCLEKRSSCWQ